MLVHYLGLYTDNNHLQLVDFSTSPFPTQRKTNNKGPNIEVGEKEKDNNAVNCEASRLNARSTYGYIDKKRNGKNKRT